MNGKLSYILFKLIKQDVYTSLLYFLHLSFNHSFNHGIIPLRHDSYFILH